MSSGISASGLITGINSSTIIAQLMQIERQPIARYRQKISTLESQKTAIRDLRSQVTTLRNRMQDFRLNTVFNSYNTKSSEETALTSKISGPDPVVGSYKVEVLQLASATTAYSSGTIGAAINPNASLATSGISTDIADGTFTINGVSFTVDADTQSLNTILGQITASSAGVNATYDAGTDRVVFTNKTAGDTSIIVFGGKDDESNLLDVFSVKGATQANGPGGATQVIGTRNLGAINVADSLSQTHFAGGTVTSGDFRINGVTISVDAANDSVSDILGRINDSDANVIASYDNATDRIQIVSKTLGSRSIRFESAGSNFLNMTNLSSATQDVGKDAQFKINDGAVQTRSTNEVSDAIGGVTLTLLSLDTSTVSVTVDDDSVVEDMNSMITAFNETVDKIAELTGTDGALASDASFRQIENFIRSGIFNRVTGVGDYASLPEIGITTGDDFDSSATSHLELDEDTFREALRDARTNVKDLFSNTSNTGIADQLYSYLDEITRTNGFLNERAKSNGSIDTQIQTLNDQIDQVEERVSRKETMLRRQYAQLERMAATYQQQGGSISGLSSAFASF